MYSVCKYGIQGCYSHHYDLSVLSMSVMGFQKSLNNGWVSELYPVFLGDFLNLFNFAKHLRCLYFELYP